jgi:RecA-family ATPase
MPHSHDDEPFPPEGCEVITPDDPRWQEAERRMARKDKGNGAGEQHEEPELLDIKAEIHRREWNIEDHIPANNVTLLSGEGAVGKSILALQLAVCTALNAISQIDHDWIGLLPKGGPALVISCEEEADEMIRRLEDTVQHYGATRRDLVEHLFMCSWVDADNTQLARLDRRNDTIVQTELYQRLLLSVMRIKPRIIVLDTAADLFGGNEISRSHTRAFIAMVRRLAIAACNNASVLLLTHPSLEGIRSGSGLSGSTAWHNSVRARCVFKHFSEKDGDDDAEPDRDLRILEWRKNNYGPPRDTATLRWKAGVWVVEGGGADTLEQQLRWRNIDAMYLDCLRKRLEQQRPVSDRPGKNYAPTEFADMPAARDAKPRITSNDFRKAMDRLFDSGRIVVKIEGSASRQRRCIVEAVAALL